MKAIVYTRYGPPEVLQLTEVRKPGPEDNEVLVKIHATTVNSGDLRLRKADPFFIRIIFGLLRPRKKILGLTLSGVVEAVGKNAKQFKAGDAVFGMAGFGFGAWAEYLCLREKFLVLKPENITHEEAAAIPFGGITAWHYLRKAGIQKGQKVLIYGASGSTGTFAVQLAKYAGAWVTAVCSGRNEEMVKSIGADKTIDYTREDFTSGEKTYDIVFDAVGKINRKKARKVLAAGGKFVTVNRGLARSRPGDMELLKNLAETGKIKAVIDKTWPLEQMIEAHRYADHGHKKGNIAITVAFGA